MRLSILRRIMALSKISDILHMIQKRNSIIVLLFIQNNSIILHMIRKPNSIIVLLFIQNNSQFKNIAKTCLPPSMLSSSLIVHVQGSAAQIFSKGQMSPFELSSCCSCHVFSNDFAQFLLLKQLKCPPFLFSQPKQLNLVPRSSRLMVH